MKVDLSPTKDRYYSQLNNELDKYISCQVTSMVAGLDIGGIGLKPIMELFTGYRQPEDKLRNYMLYNQDVQSFCLRSHGKTGIPAPEWADCMCFAVNRLYRQSVASYDDKLSLDKIKADLQNGLPVYTSMAYPDNKNNSGVLAPVSGHIVLIVGINEDDSLIINDPYKNHLLQTPDGWHNVYTREQFARHNKGYGIRYKK